jgi:phenylalanyl-tRNA synthetase beta chain
MEFSLSWLADYVDLPADPQELAKRLTAAGLAVEGVSARDGDTVMDIDITTNRPDCMNHFGLAREIAVLYGRPLCRPAAAPVEVAERAAGAARVTLEDPEGCPRFAAPSGCAAGSRRSACARSTTWSTSPTSSSGSWGSRSMPMTSRSSRAVSWWRAGRARGSG